MSYVTLIFAFFIAILFFAVVDYNQLRKMRTQHERLAELGAILITKYELTDRQEAFIKGCLDDIFQWWFLPYSLLMLPVVMIQAIGKKKSSLPTAISELSKYEEFHEFKQIHMNSLFSSNSLFAIIFFVVVFVVMIPVFLIGGIMAAVKIPQTAIYETSPRFKGGNVSC